MSELPAMWRAWIAQRVAEGVEPARAEAAARLRSQRGEVPAAVVRQIHAAMRDPWADGPGA